MASFDYRLNPLYPIKECSSCGALYTTDYCYYEGSLGDKIICDVNKTPDLSQRPPQNCPKCGNPVDGHYCQGCAHYGYNCPPKVSIVPNLEPFNNQTVDELPQTLSSFGPTCYSGDGNSFTYDSKSNLVDDSPNVFDHLRNLLCILVSFVRTVLIMVTIVHLKFRLSIRNCVTIKTLISHKVFMIFNNNICCENYGGPHEAYQCQPMNEDYYHEQNSFYDPNFFGFDQFKPLQYTVNHPIFNAQNDLFNSQNKLMEQLISMCDMVGQYIQKNEEEKQTEKEQAAKVRYWKIPVCYDNDDDEDYTIAITHKEPDNSLSMGDEHLDTIPVTESDEFIKYSVENLVPNPSESEGEYECDVPACEDFTTFSNILFDADYDFSFSDDQSFSDEDISKKIYSNPFFDEEIFSIKIDPHHFNTESDLIESLLNHDSSIISFSSKIDSLRDEFADELTLLKLIPSRINETDCDREEEIHLIKRLLNDSLSLAENESFHFDIPSSSRPPTKPPDSNSGILNVKVMGDISEHNVPMSRLMLTLVPNQEKSPDLLSHLGHEASHPSTECPMMIYGRNTPILDVPFLHFYPP
nr:hypothetical protein [Tanacetum cinerariifolium]